MLCPCPQSLLEGKATASLGTPRPQLGPQLAEPLLPPPGLDFWEGQLKGLAEFGIGCPAGAESAERGLLAGIPAGLGRWVALEPQVPEVLEEPLVGLQAVQEPVPVLREGHRQPISLPGPVEALPPSHSTGLVRLRQVQDERLVVKDHVGAARADPVHVVDPVPWKAGRGYWLSSGRAPCSRQHGREGGSRGQQHLTWVEFDVGGNTGGQEGNAHRPGNGLLIVKDLKPVQVSVAKELPGYRALKPAGRDRAEQGLPSFAPAGQLKRAEQESGLVLGALKIWGGEEGEEKRHPREPEHHSLASLRESRNHKAGKEAAKSQHGP